jgi:hypothetical protein
LQIFRDLGLPHETSNSNISFVFRPINLLSWPVDLLVLRIHKESSSSATQAIVASVKFTNNARLQLDGSDIFDKRLIYLEPEQDQFIFIPVRGIPIWSFGGNCQTIKISFPKSSHLSVSKAYAASIENLMPKIILNNSHGEGGLDLNSRNQKCAITYDASSINNCTGVAIEVIGDSEHFEELNTLNSQYSALGQPVSMHAKGQIIFDRNMFPHEGLFKVRLRPIDKNGKQTSFCSDHFTVTVSK